MKYLMLVPLVFLVGCTEEDDRESKQSVDQCKRVELFQMCMDSLPAGPEKTQYNDWDEVVGECVDFALYSSKRVRSQIPLNCRAH